MAALPSAQASVNAKCCNTTANKTPAAFPLVRVPAKVLSMENHLPVGEMLHDMEQAMALQATANAVVALNHLMQIELAQIKEKLAAIHAELMEGINDESYTDDEADEAGPAKKKARMMYDSDDE